MGAMISPSTVVVASIILAVLVLLYRAALPRPIPGIPYHHASARSVLGDIPSMVKWKNETRETFSWMTAQCKLLNSPMIQLFVKPFTKPWVVVTDARECQDVLVRRSREFDRATFTTDAVQPILREHFFPMPSGPTQRAHKALLADTMTPAFLNEVAAPQLYKNTLEMLELWRRKALLARGHPFAADKDVANTALDTIWASAVGTEAQATKTQLDLLAKTSEIEVPANPEAPAVFPQAPTRYDVVAIRTVIETLEIGISSPIPWLSYWFYKKLPSIGKAFHRKDELLNIALNNARNRREKDGSANVAATSAMDYIIRREISAAKRENRLPQLEAQVLKDELFGYVLAGHETTSTAMSWGLKFLTEHQDVQAKLLHAMRDAMPEALSTGRQPTYSEIVAAKMPYFDAVIEETLRCSNVAPVQARMCLVDTELLGVRLPKGTNVLFMLNGPSYIAPPMHIDERLRSKSSQASKHNIGEWDPTDLSEFKPQRWLKTDGEGQVKMDFQAGPNTQFGGGPRGCFGKTFAYLEMRTVMSIIFWNFKLLPVAAELSSHRAFDCVTHHPEQCYVRLVPV